MSVSSVSPALVANPAQAQSAVANLESKIKSVEKELTTMAASTKGDANTRELALAAIQGELQQLQGQLAQAQKSAQQAQQPAGESNATSLSTPRGDTNQFINTTA